MSHSEPSLSAATTAPPLLLADRGCPFGHRVLAALDHLGVAHEHRESPGGQLPDGLDLYSPSGRIPLLIHGPLVISESRVMLEYLADGYGFESAYPLDLVLRTRHRHAMALIDAALTPGMTRGGDTTIDELRLAEYLGHLEEASLHSPPEPSLLAFHVAPIWLRLQWWHPEGRLTRAIRHRPQLRAWFDAAAALDAIVRTAPGQAENTREYHAAIARRDAAAAQRRR